MTPHFVAHILDVSNLAVTASVRLCATPPPHTSSVVDVAVVAAGVCPPPLVAIPG
ncbi:hypothetical protein [Pseudomonas akapageensis]|uniref:hypothetical protein n=1 Tax=Pseudomonas akapageensis TaxID=2609961 RepID=UPI001409FCDA|nr:hypothetical protein [Pseudomonas akapageensis]